MRYVRGMWRLAVAVVVLAGCVNPDRFQFAWDDRQILCSVPADDLSGDDAIDHVRSAIESAASLDSAALVHVHGPGSTVSIDRLETIFDLAERHDLAYATYADMDGGPSQAALALAFDDNSVEAWLSIRDLLKTRGARVTFFVARFASLTEAERDGIAILAADGHAIEAHTVNHLDAPDYIAAHGVDAYLADEVLPSFQVLVDAGYHPTAFAYPFGRDDAAADSRILERATHLRVGPASCPY